MKSRIDFHNLLVATVTKWATDNNKQIPKIYYQPPENTKLTYPCVIYNLDRIKQKYADELSYKNDKQYSLTIIDKDPDSKLPDYFMKLKCNSFDRCFTTENLYHYVFTIFY